MKISHPGHIVKIGACIFIGFFCVKESVAQKGEMDEYLQEFFLSETVFPQEAKEIQFTLKPYLSQSDDTHFSIPLTVEYGITDRLQVEIEVPYLISSSKKRTTIQGMENLEIGVLYNVIKSNRPFALSMGVEFPLKTASRKIREYDPETSVEAIIIAARQFGKAQIHAKMGSEISAGKSTMNYGVASIFKFGRCKPTFELNWDNEEARTLSVTPGVLWTEPGGLEFGMAFSTKVPNTYASWGVIASFTYEFSLARD